MTVPVVFIQEAPTKLQGTSFDLGVGEKRRFPGGILGRHRKQIIVTNEDNSDKLYICIGDPDSATATGKARSMTIFPNTSITLFTSDDITLFNPSASNVVSTVQVLEIFYTGAGGLVV
jgi:hypothetical protein